MIIFVVPLRSSGCLSSFFDSSYRIFGPFGCLGGCQVREMIDWETGVASGADWPPGTVAWVRTFTG